jgi:TM2 domain-containing membrane protein YozV
VAQSEVAQKKLIAGILGIVLNGLGVHRFYLGDTKGGIIRIVISVLTCGLGGVIGIIEGIIYLTKSDEEFQKIYIEGKKAWF